MISIEIKKLFKYAKQAFNIARYTFKLDHEQFKIYEDHINKITEKR